MSMDDSRVQRGPEYHETRDISGWGPIDTLKLSSDGKVVLHVLKRQANYAPVTTATSSRPVVPVASVPVISVRISASIPSPTAVTVPTPHAARSSGPSVRSTLWSAILNTESRMESVERFNVSSHDS